jgi:hypothetical protein
VIPSHSLAISLAGLLFLLAIMNNIFFIYVYRLPANVPPPQFLDNFIFGLLSSALRWWVKIGGK